MSVRLIVAIAIVYSGFAAGALRSESEPPGKGGGVQESVDSTAGPVLTKREAMAPDKAVEFVGTRWSQDKNDKSLMAASTSPELMTVSFRVEKVSVVIGSQNPETASPILLVAKRTGEKGVDFSVLLMKEIPATLARLGVSDYERHFTGKTIEVTGIVQKFPPAPGSTRASPTYAIWATTVNSVRVLP